MLTQTPQSATTHRGAKKRLVVLLPADVVDKLKEMSQRTGLPVSLIVALAVANIAYLEIPRYTKPKTKKKT